MRFILGVICGIVAILLLGHAIYDVASCPKPGIVSHNSITGDNDCIVPKW